MRTALQCCIVPIPIVFVVPQFILYLMLHEEKPNADGRCYEDYRYVNQQKIVQTNQPDKGAEKQQNKKVRSHGTDPWMPTGSHQAYGQTVLHEK